MTDNEVVEVVRERGIWSDELPSWTVTLIYAIDANEGDDGSIEKLAGILDKSKAQIKKYLRDPRIVEKRAEWLAISMRNAVEKAQAVIEPAVDNVVAVIRGEEKFSDRTEMSVVHLKGMGFYGTRVMMQHKVVEPELYHKQVFKELNSKHEKGDWDELVKWYEEEEEGRRKGGVGCDVKAEDIR